VSDELHPQLTRVLGVPLAAIGVFAAVLVWELEHVGSLALGGVLALCGIAAAIVMARRVRARIERLSRYYESLLRLADEQSHRAETANRLKDEFLSTLSHELRTPLNSVLGWARLLASGKLDARQTTRAIEAIERAGWAQSRLIEDLLDVSRIVAGKLELSPRPTRVQPLVSAAVHALRQAAEARRIGLTTDLDPAIGPITADPDRLQQIAWNLVSNAIKFTPSGGHVRVTLTADAQQIRLTVSDTGVGFRPDIAAHLFERFRQADSSSTRQYGGLGLGLGIVRHLAELHGGTVSAESAGENRGSVFTVTLPAVAAVELPADTPPPAPILRGITVLAIDDDPPALDFVKSALEQYGAVVTTAASAPEARVRLAEAVPDAIVCDVMMPQEDGLDFIRGLRARVDRPGSRTPAAALTGLARNDDRRRALAAGFQMHVAKPIDPYELALAVDRLTRGGDRTAARAAS
jgi:signal transduction histidine kinase/CheY-like chemotaxis protein